MSQTASSRKQQQQPSVKEEAQPESTHALHDAAHLSQLWHDFARRINEFAPHDAELVKKLLSIQRILEEPTREELTSPIKDWQEFTLRLSQVERAYKQARFDSNLRDGARSLYEFLRENKREDQPEFWKAHTLLYELNDIFHLDPGINDEAKSVGKRLEYELNELVDEWKQAANIAPDQRGLIQEKVIYCSCRGNELKRGGDAEGARRLFEWLLDITTGTNRTHKNGPEFKLKTSDLPCLGIQATLTYHLGSVYRVLEQHELAEDMYTQTLNLLYEKSRRSRDNDPDDHFLIVRNQARAVGIGFGWVNLTRGFLRNAENALTTARSLLARSSDPVVPSYIELLYGMSRRCRAGTDKKKLREAIESLERALREFKENRHERYIPRACWELSLALHLAGENSEAQKYLNVVAEYAERTKHLKWQTNVRILQSRILRSEGDYQMALREAELAVTVARECKSILPLMDAYITRGEANLCIAGQSNQYESNYSTARSDFESALQLVLNQGGAERTTGLPSNPKIAGVCHLRIAQCYARERNEAKAKEHFAVWEFLRTNVEHEWVRELADKVKSEIDSLSYNFTISAKDQGEWDYAENVTRLRGWLLTQALRQTKRNYSEAAKLIGVKRATLYQWQEDSRSKSKRARINGSGDQH